MSDKQMQTGMNWVVARLSRLGHDQGMAISPIGWSADTVDLHAHRHRFVLLMNGLRQVVTFDDADLEDLPEDPRLQIQVESEFRALLTDQLTGSVLPV